MAVEQATGDRNTTCRFCNTEYDTPIAAAYCCLDSD